ncbi:MAG: hypothetical protein HY287_11165 [Planctomycetes bacterium]|nr:hypothetical protein [Planctomycetota bacterium]MBI3834878.1 hypothetical protein [Planctomycetota bacterium]
MRRGALCVSICVWILSFVSISPAIAQTFPSCIGGTGDCFSGHNGPGCNDLCCCETVCNPPIRDTFCCDTLWDAQCANEALGSCPLGDFVDCNSNGTSDICDIAQGTSRDCNGNNVPDECEVPPLCPTCSDSNHNGVPDDCELGACCMDPATTACSVVLQADCLSERWIIDGTCVPNSCPIAPSVTVLGCRYLQIELSGMDPGVPFSIAITSLEHSCMSKYVAFDNGIARLVGNPVSLTPTQWGTIILADENIVPSTTYVVRTESVMGMSAPASATMMDWADVVPTIGLVNISDIAAIVDNFKNVPTAPPLERCDLGPATPDGIVNISDVADAVDAFKALPYPFPGPAACVECLNNADCDDANACTTDACEDNNTCSNTSIPDCCNLDADCDDGHSCTADVCSSNACLHTQIPGCIEHTIATFTDSVSGFSTQDVRDVDNEIVHFDPNRMSIIYVATGTEYQIGSWPVNGNFLGFGGFFQVRFGTVLGEYRAYFTETGSGTICNFVVTPTNFSIFATNTQVPHT